MHQPVMLYITCLRKLYIIMQKKSVLSLVKKFEPADQNIWNVCVQYCRLWQDPGWRGDGNNDNTALITARHHLTCNQPTVKQETAQEYQTNSFLSYTIYFSIKLAYNFLSQWHCLDPFPPLVSGVYNAHLHTTHLAIWDHKRIWTTNIKMYLRD